MRAMHIHILGICGTFMGSLAILARQMGWQVSGSDQHVYPPMSTQLEEQGIVLSEGYDPAHLRPAPDLVVIGNTCSRGNPAVEYVLDAGLDYCSGPEWLARHVLMDRWVLAAAGTHGKTTTASMLAWVLHHAGLRPGYLIGGVPKNFNVSADLGGEPFFVIEADEYDSAFFDKRSKFIHYRPRTLIIGNLEFDHADIFPDLEAIQTQFHHLVRTVPGGGVILSPAGEQNIEQIFEKGVWSERQCFTLDNPAAEAAWRAEWLEEEGGAFRIAGPGGEGEVRWELSGRHNVYNALAAVAAAAHAGVPPAISCEALGCFKGVRRRMELIGRFSGVAVYDDFAHHPTAIKTTLEGFRRRHHSAGETGKVIAVIEARSNTMKMGYHQHTLAPALADADCVLWYRNPDTRLDLEAIAAGCKADFHVFSSTSEIIDFAVAHARPGDSIIIMSNGGFEGLHHRLTQALS